MKRIEEIEEKINLAGEKMDDLAKFATPTHYNPDKAKQYYDIKYERDDLLKQYYKLLDQEQSKKNIMTTKTFVNSYGEATQKYITSATYERAQKRLSKQIEIFLTRKSA